MSKTSVFAQIVVVGSSFGGIDAANCAITVAFMNVVALTPNGAPVDWETIPAAATRSGRHAVTIRRALQAGELHGHQRVFGGRWLIHPSALDAWVRGDPDTMTPCGCRPARTRRGA